MPQEKKANKTKRSGLGMHFVMLNIILDNIDALPARYPPTQSNNSSTEDTKIKIKKNGHRGETKPTRPR